MLLHGREGAHLAVLGQTERGGASQVRRRYGLALLGPANWIILVGLIISNYFERDYSAAVDVAQRMIRDYPGLDGSV